MVLPNKARGPRLDFIRVPLIIQCSASREKIFLSDETKFFARSIESTRRNFVKYDGKASADSTASGFSEVPSIPAQSDVF